MKNLCKYFMNYAFKASLAIILISIAISCSKNSSGYQAGLTGTVLMKKAVPVWAEGREKEMNLNLGFRGTFKAKPEQSIKLSITASTLYRIFLNGEFLGCGPARAAHGYYRVDEYDLSEKVKSGENIIAIEVAGYNVNSFYTLDQPSFLLTEVVSDGKVLLYTGRKNDFEVFQLTERLQKVERYSFQRPFTEYYRLSDESGKWKSDATVIVKALKSVSFPQVRLLSRNIPWPDFKLINPLEVNSRGAFELVKPQKYYKDRSLININEKLKGYLEQELEILPSQLVQEFKTISLDTAKASLNSDNNTDLKEKEFRIYDFGTNLTGFIGGTIQCQTPCTVYLCFDEMLTDGDVNPKRRMPDVNNQVVYELAPGRYNIESFEAYTLKFLKIAVYKGSCTISDFYIREYAFPEFMTASFQCSNNKLNKIFGASEQTFRQNAVDVLTDCPSRERAGWLCDSYFSAIMEKDFTGASLVTHNYLENYALPDSFSHLPEGMIPMCYPADHYDGVFIPNWAMWFIIQVNDFAQRGGDTILVSQLRPRIEELLKYYSRFENEDGLLEGLKSWIFVEWSKANDFVQDVNYPSNMLYSAALKSAADLYGNETWRSKSEQVRKMVLQQSFNGNFFVDNAIRNKEGKLQPTNNTTEVCQYYAFFFNLATPETHPELWNKLIKEFGPNRNSAITYPNVYRANAFIGNYIRMDILSRYGLQNQLIKEVQDYFYSMAQRTGTLWEMMDNKASCNHGFASYLGHVLNRDVLGIKTIDYLNKEIIIRFTDIDLEECSGSIPVDSDVVELKWKRDGNKIHYVVKVPGNYNVTVENLSKSEIVKTEKL